MTNKSAWAGAGSASSPPKSVGGAKFVETVRAVVRFAGDSGDGMQTVGEQFTDSSALYGNDIRTFPDFPAEIRAPAGTLPGVSGFQIQFGSEPVLTPGDAPDALVAMNPAALKTNLSDLIPTGMLVVNEDAFSEDNLKLAGYESNPLEDENLIQSYQLIRIPMTELTKQALADSPLKPSQRVRCKNFFALGFMFWTYDRPIEHTIKWIEKKWAGKTEIIEANVKVLKAGYYFGDTCEVARNRYSVNKAIVEPGRYRKISGNEAIVLGLIAASKACGRELLFSGYPITPASSILEGIARHKNFGVKTVQAEDEIASAGIALGASFTGALGVTATSGPGICLKAEFMGLAVITELPLLVFNIQRAGPSTGLPTKTEQADLLQAMFGRNGECPLPILAPDSPADCFDIVIEATRLALKYRTPVLVLSDGSIAGGAEPWKIPDVSSLPDISVPNADPAKPYVIYRRDPVTLARELAIPGQVGLEHRIGGLEKNEAGGVSYDPENHERMVETRAAKVQGIARDIEPLAVKGPAQGKLLVLGWGSTFGAITAACESLRRDGVAVSNAHLRHLNPFPDNLGSVLAGFEKVLIPELNLGQLVFLIRARYLVDAIRFTKVQGRPFTVAEMKTRLLEVLG